MTERLIGFSHDAVVVEPLPWSLHQGRPATLTPSEKQADVARSFNLNARTIGRLRQFSSMKGFQWAIRRTHEPAKLVASHIGPYDDETMGRSM
jgi:hypothetical protein